MPSKKSKHISLRIPYLFVIAGILSIAGAIFSRIQTNAFISKAIITEALVADLAYYKSDGTYAPIITFKTLDGIEKTVKSSSRSKPSAYSIGDTVKVAYLQSNSNSWMIFDFWSKYLVTIVAGFLGMVFTAVGGVIVYFIGNRYQVNDRKNKKRVGKGREAQWP
jgi:ABC-type phosphate/phosphonate transport system permease subunit